MPLQDKVFMLGSLSVKKDTVFKRGYEIKRINDVGTDSMISVCKKMITGDGFINTGKDYYLKLGFNSYYPALFGRPDTFKVEYTSNHEIKTIKYPAIHVRSFPPIPLSPKDDSLFTVYKRANMKFRYLDQTNKTFLLKITAFSRKKEKKAYRKIFRRLEKNKTENLIIDLRNNGGGSLANSYRLLSYLLTKNETQTLKTAIKNYPYRKYTSGNIWFRSMRFVFKIVGTKKTINDTDNYIYTIKKSKKHHYDNKVFVLINGGSFSASCLVAAYLKMDKRAVFIGEETSGTMEGCNAGITPYYKLPNTKMKLRVPAFRVQHDVCAEITGRGIIPEYKVTYTFNDILKRKDLELEKVKELIK